MCIPIKMKNFFNAEISIYSLAGFFIYLFKDFLQRFSTKIFYVTVYVDFSQRCLKIFTKQIKCRYLHKINEKSRAGINEYFYLKTPYNGNSISSNEKSMNLMNIQIFSRRVFTFTQSLIFNGIFTSFSGKEWYFH